MKIARHPLEARVIAEDLRAHGKTIEEIRTDLRFFGHDIAHRTIQFWVEKIPDPRIATRERALSLLRKGVKTNTVANIVGVYYSTVIDWRKKYLDGTDQPIN